MSLDSSRYDDVRKGVLILNEMPIASCGLEQIELNTQGHDLITETGGKWTQDPVLCWCMADDPANCCMCNSAWLIGKFI